MSSHVYVYMCMHTHEHMRRMEVSSGVLSFSTLFCEKGWRWSLPPAFPEVYLAHLSSARISGTGDLKSGLHAWVASVYKFNHLPSPQL